MAKAAIVYVGTADGLVTFSSPGGSATWRQSASTLEGSAVQMILAADALHVTVLTDTGAERTEDGCQTWSHAEPQEAEHLRSLLDSSEPLLATAQGLARWPGEHTPAPGTSALAMLSGRQEILLAAIADGSTLIRSEDGGETWAQVEFTDGLEGAITTIMPSSYHIDTAWLGTDRGQLWSSENRGRSWELRAALDQPILALAILRLI